MEVTVEFEMRVTSHNILENQVPRETKNIAKLNMGGTGKPDPRTMADKQQSMRWIEQSVVRRMAGSIKSTVQAAVEQSQFLLSTPQGKTAVFHRAEIMTARVALGNGGFSTVYEIVGIIQNPLVSERCTDEQKVLRDEMANNVLDENGKSRFIIKLLSRRLLSNPKFFGAGARDLAMEAEYMTRLEHPNILSIVGLPVDGLDAFASGNCEGYFIIAERLEQPLNTAVKEWNTGVGCPSLEKRVEYALSIGKAIEYLHSKRIVFRDLKPANIGISSSDEIKIFDFGLCREVPLQGDANLLSFNMSWVGTQRYMSAEVLEQGKYNLKADVYSWALVTWEVLTGCQPYNGYGKQKHIIAVLQNDERPFLVQKWPKWLQKTLRNSWCRSTEHRYSMATAVSALERREEPKPEVPISRPRSESPVLFRNRTNLIATRSGAVSMVSRRNLYAAPRVSTIHISVF